MTVAKAIWLDEFSHVDISPAMWARLAKHITSMKFVLLPSLKDVKPKSVKL
ncbi:hypothetical protein LCGC14_1375750 [marine sediment metagenome]|uniref:Uncharacterized protein n=1 Tax=marine sediment metagenome TaxID=412755 RepID=A0A0F9N645_9ZZZZ